MDYIIMGLAFGVFICLIIVHSYLKKYADRYIVTQIIHSDTTYSQLGNGTTYNVALITRFVIANNREEAIGKFIKDTKNIKAIKKLDIDCYKILDYTPLK
jgi:hypothetical protein